ncbi:hypothetical protein GCM10017691_10720 [Pseudonocardia petroleophila]
MLAGLDRAWAGSRALRVGVPAAVWRRHRMGELSSPSAAVLVVRAADRDTVRFVAFDRALRDVAAVKGSPLVPVS